MTEHTTPSGEPTVVLIHGAFANSLTFAPLQAALAGHGVRSAALDLPGHGFAASVPAGYHSPQDLSTLATSPSAMAGVSLDDAVDSLAEALVSFRRFGPVIVLAHSRGGVALTALANAHPELVDHLVYVSAWAPVDLEATAYNGEPEMAGGRLHGPRIPARRESGRARGAARNFRAAAGEQLAALKNLFAADRGRRRVPHLPQHLPDR